MRQTKNKQTKNDDVQLLVNGNTTVEIEQRSRNLKKKEIKNIINRKIRKIALIMVEKS